MYWMSPQAALCNYVAGEEKAVGKNFFNQALLPRKGYA